MSGLARGCRRFAASTRGIVAVEFAIMLPVLLLLLLASIDAGRAIAVYMKVRSATYTLDAITNQYTSIQDADMTQILGATSVVLSPFASTPARVVLSQVLVVTPTQGTVMWSDTLNGTARTVGSTVTIPTGLASAGSYLIFGEVGYTYTPMFGYFVTGSLNLSDNLYVTPRSVACITRKNTPTACN